MVVPDASAYDWSHVSKMFHSNLCAYTHLTTSPGALITPTSTQYFDVRPASLSVFLSPTYTQHPVGPRPHSR